jgi:hypothetical protein
MRVLLAILATTVVVTAAAAQTNPPSDKVEEVRKSDGQTYLPAHQDNKQQQPQGPTGPLNTTTGGAPAESPQGQTPPGMQSAPEGSRKDIVDPERK